MLPIISRRRNGDNDMNIDNEENQPFIDPNNSDNNNNVNNPLINVNLNNDNNGLRQMLNPENFEITATHQLYALLLCATCIIGCVCSFWVFISIAQIIALHTEWNKKCDVPLRKWMLVNLLLPFIFGATYLSFLLLLHFLPNNYVSNTNRRRYKLYLQKIFSNRTEIFIYSFWILQGYNWWSKTKTCQETAPVLYYVAILSLWISSIRLIIQFIVQCCIRVMNPMVYEQLRRQGLIDPNNQQNMQAIYRNLISNNFFRGTPNRVIHQLQTQIFDTNDSNNINDIESANNNNNNNNRLNCAICLAQFENGEELRVLPCQHSFHTECIDQWLRGHRTCPMCRIDVTVQRQ
eukprot:86345_1